MEHHAELRIASSRLTAGLDEELNYPSADISHITIGNFGITDARSLTAAAATRPVMAKERIFVIFFTTATHEAQNALLKLFEEPPATSRFVIITPRAEGLVATLRSRLQLVAVADSTIPPEYLLFRDSGVAERLEQVLTNTKQKNVLWIQAIQAGLQQYMQSGSGDEASAVLFVEQHLNRRGASNKLLLEELALILPVGATT